MKQILTILLIIGVGPNLTAQILEIGIMRSYSVSKLQLTHLSGNYVVYGDSGEVCRIKESQSVILKRSGDLIKISKGGKVLGEHSGLRIKEINSSSSLKLEALAPSSHRLRKYKNDFRIKPEGASNLLVINVVEMDNYLAGVVESEGGGGKDLEYYKVQAILSRTYALDHLHRHVEDGFQLCDNVHCQAYHNMLRYSPGIGEAVAATQNLIMIAADLKLAKSFFFANCGGQTSESDFVWNRPIAHCKSVSDTFCIRSKQANWTKKIKKSSWRNYMVNHFGFPEKDSVLGPLMYNFIQANRHAFYHFPHLGIPLRDIRIKFKLKSTWFSCSLNGDYVVLKGHGFGHGVGLCQEGSMRMARLGYSHHQILNYYFTGIDIMTYREWLFLRQGSEELNVGL
ncbi:SpoIID/LytB domain-containing protein [Crocinitomix catalasitica]|nr:SpoIID/LytB domain-containing protein [Crocinitomix catalasitica]